MLDCGFPTGPTSCVKRVYVYSMCVCIIVVAIITTKWKLWSWICDGWWLCSSNSLIITSFRKTNFFIIPNLPNNVRAVPGVVAVDCGAELAIVNWSCSRSDGWWWLCKWCNDPAVFLPIKKRKFSTSSTPIFCPTISDTTYADFDPLLRPIVSQFSLENVVSHTTLDRWMPIQRTRWSSPARTAPVTFSPTKAYKECAAFAAHIAHPPTTHDTDSEICHFSRNIHRDFRTGSQRMASAFDCTTGWCILGSNDTTKNMF